MLVDALLRQFADTKAIDPVFHKLDAGEDAGLAVAQSARPLIVALNFVRRPRPTCVIVSGEEAAERFANTVAAYIGRDRVLRLPERNSMPLALTQDELACVGRRLMAVHALSRGDDVVVVASARSLLRSVPLDIDIASPLVLTAGEDLPDGLVYEELAQRLVDMGYSRGDAIDGAGTFALHGDTLDIHPAGSVYPVRVEFFGDSIDALRRVVPATGQSVADLPCAEVFPATEVPLTPKAQARAGKLMEPLTRQDSQAAADLERILAGIVFPGMERYMPYMYEKVGSPLLHASENALVVVVEPRALFDDATRSYEETAALPATAGDLMKLYCQPAALDFGMQQRLSLLSLMRVGGTVDAELAISRPDVMGSADKLFAQFHSLLKSGFKAVFSIPDRATRDALRLDLVENLLPIEERLDATERAGSPDAGAGEAAGLDAAALDSAATAAPDATATPAATAASPSSSASGLAGRAAKPRASHGTLAPNRPLDGRCVTLTDVDIPAGLIIPGAKLGIVTMGDIAPRTTRRHVRRTIDPTAMTFPYKPGDYVVHQTHGIALFSEIVRQEVAGIERDYLLLEYADGDKLYVPVEQIDRVTRFVGPTGAAPRLTRLNTTDWTRATGRARNAAKKLAFDLVDLYARRSTVTGHRYPPDTPWQLEMEADFPFEETPDQLAAVADVKADMESDKPMDRLVCGDVGFGKTEVALRAAFKAVQDSKQVMVLCPTTILAQQHYTTFSDRFAPYGVIVHVMSRFRTAKQQEETLAAFAEGKVDVLVGTHRLLSSDVNPKELGLVIIDEEQRFGVQHKEQIKNLREQVDVLSMTATPIPRTMQMALSGVRDMSTINTPPGYRVPVKVHVGEWDGDVVSQAIRFEVARKGQVYYVSNHVKSMEEALRRVHDAAPEARVGVAHGQMAARDVEAAMEAFAAGEFDVLVSTTIIESGIDNPHTNTLIIEDSQRFGLSQLYQLKGRVGRSRTQAYAYFLFPANDRLTDKAKDRLQAIAENQELGSGMRIAMKDLEIRGAGTLLGAEQHGNLSAVGFDLFSQMLSEAVSNARGEAQIAYADIKVDLPVQYFLPEEYMPAADERVLYYRRIAGAADDMSLNRIAEDMRSRYGDLPDPAMNLIDRSRIKALAAEAGVSSVILRSWRLVFDFSERPACSLGAIKKRGGIYIAAKKRLTYPVSRDEALLPVAIDVLKMIVAAIQENAEKQGDD